MNQVQTLLLLLLLPACASASTLFVNFETAPVHPIALSPNGKMLAVCNLPDGAVEFYRLENGILLSLGNVRVGIDPVTVRFRDDRELWVVNALSDSIDIIDVDRFTLTRVVPTQTRPADVVFAGRPLRAFVSCPPDNAIQVFEPDTGQLVRTIGIEAERPKALATSPDGLKVYVAIFESGNGTTILAPRFGDLGHSPPAGPADLPIGPYAGLNPPPNRGANFYPSLTNGLSLPARLSLIVRKQPDGRWLDDNQADWTQMVSGTNAAFSGRAPGWDLLDHDVAVIDASTFEISFIDHLMNICMDVAVDPKSGTLAVVGTEAINEVRYEPVLKGIFTRAEIAFAESAGHSRRRSQSPI